MDKIGGSKGQLENLLQETTDSVSGIQSDLWRLQASLQGHSTDLCQKTDPHNDEGSRDDDTRALLRQKDSIIEKLRAELVNSKKRSRRRATFLPSIHDEEEENRQVLTEENVLDESQNATDLKASACKKESGSSNHEAADHEPEHGFAPNRIFELEEVAKRNAQENIDLQSKLSLALMKVADLETKLDCKIREECPENSGE